MTIRYPVLSVQRALIGAVTPNLRAVFVENAEENFILTFCYEQVPSSEEEELASVADTEFIADFPDSQTEFKIIIVPYPQQMLLEGQCVYKRYEPLLNGEIAKLEASYLDSQKSNREKNITQLLLSANIILLGKVTPSLRVAFIGEINDKLILTLCYEQALSLVEEKIAALAEIEFMSLFPPPQFNAEVKIIVVHPPQKVVAKGRCVYKRYEHHEMA
jgi:membrane-associated HD superfamily phosphohydrolase